MVSSNLTDTLLETLVLSKLLVNTLNACPVMKSVEKINAGWDDRKVILHLGLQLESIYFKGINLRAG